MNNLITKAKLSIRGAGGGGGGGGSSPPPATITQYPAVLVPPQMGDSQVISSFSYAEIVDLISDGPIEGLVNKNGNKVYDENIFEGIYFNDVPVKETSRVNSQAISIISIKDAIKSFWSSFDWSYPSAQVIYTDDILFPTGITLESWGYDSISQFISESGVTNPDAYDIINRGFSLYPVNGQQLFLTVVTIPKFIAYLSKDKFDATEGGVNGDYPLKISLPNISNHIYFDIGHESLNSFNYFEMPRSFAKNSQLTNAGKKTFSKSLISQDDDFFKYEIYNTKLFIWSVYDLETGVKNVDKILDVYLKHLYIYQHNPSLYNYNLVQSEFLSGSEMQPPLKNFDNVQIDNQYDKQLIGPFRLTNTTGQGVQRLTSLCGSPFSTNVSLENETSDDVRYIKSWPVEYDSRGNSYLICNLCANYASFDKTSATRSCQDAVPVTHYVVNQNVEDVFVTVNVQSLYDTAHVDLITNNSSSIAGNPALTKWQNTEATLCGTKSYGQLAGAASFQGNTLCSKYLLIFGNSICDGYVLDGSSSQCGVLENLCNVISNKTLYYSSISHVGLSTQIPNVCSYIGNGAYMPTQDNGLNRFLIPSSDSLVKNSFKINQYVSNLADLEGRLKLTDAEGSMLYCFGLVSRDSIVGTCALQDLSVGYTPLSSINATNASCATACGYNLAGQFFIAKFSYYTASSNELKDKAIISTKINEFIDWNAIFNEDATWNSTAKTLTRSDRNFALTYSLQIYQNPEVAVLMNLFLNQEPTFSGGVYTLSVANFNASYQILLIGLNKEWLTQNTSYWSGSYLTLSTLQSLLKYNSVQSFNANVNFTSKIIYNEASNSEFKNLLNRVNSALVGSSFAVFSVQPLAISNTSNATYFLDSSFRLFNANNIYVINKDYVQADPAYDYIFKYQLFNNTTVTSANSLGSAQTYWFKDVNTNSGGNAPTCANFANATQQITAGTKLPAVVSLKVETGYESTEGSSSVGPNEYFSYQYDIFGISTNDGALVDIGRKNYDFVYSKKLSSDFGQFLTNRKNVYYNSNALYLYEVVSYTDGAQVGASRYFLKDKKILNIPEFNKMNFYHTVSDSSLGVEYIVDGGVNIGLQKSVASLTEVNAGLYLNGADGLLDYEIPITSSDPSLPSLSNFFDYNLKIFNLAVALPWMRRSINGSTLIGESIHPIEGYVEAHSVNPLNTANITDTYKVYVDADNYVKINIHTFQYSAYENLKTGAESTSDLEYLATPYNIAFYIEGSKSGQMFVAKTLLANARADEVVLEYDYTGQLIELTKPISGAGGGGGGSVSLSYVTQKVDDLQNLQYYKAIRLIIRITKGNLTLDSKAVQKTLDDAFISQNLPGHTLYSSVDSQTILNFMSNNRANFNSIISEMRKKANFLPRGLTFDFEKLIEMATAGTLSLQNKAEVTNLTSLSAAIAYLVANPSLIKT